METLEMPGQKNLHAAVPSALLARAEAIAQQEQVSLDELAAQAFSSAHAGIAVVTRAMTFTIASNLKSGRGEGE